MAETDEPIEGYDELTVTEIVDEMEGMSASEVQAVKEYEHQGKARKTVLQFEADGGDDDEDEEPPPGGPDEQAKLDSAIQTAAVIAEGAPDPVVSVDGRNRKHGDDGLEGHFVHVLAGDHEGRTAAFVQVLSREDDGYPDEILVRSRDADNILFGVAYSDVETAGDYHGGR